MKMFLTRLGLTLKDCQWDISQIDLPRNVKSGLIDVQRNWRTFLKLTCAFSAKDVVRHPVVAEIIRAYELIPNPVLKEAPDVEEEADKRQRSSDLFNWR